MMTKKRKVKQTTSSSSDDELSLKERLELVEEELANLKEENKLLQSRVLVLEDRAAIATNASDKLRSEVDRLDQYQRRSNVILKNVAVPNKQTQEGDEKFVKNLFDNELNLPDAFQEVDKLHRLGPIRTSNDGKKTQDIVVRFRSHATRYKVYDERKKTKTTKIRPNLTKRRRDLLYRASNLVKDLDAVHFVFANDHGDLKIRLKEKMTTKSNVEKQYFDFDSMEVLKETLRDLKIDFVDDILADDE